MFRRVCARAHTHTLDAPVCSNSPMMRELLRSSKIDTSSSPLVKNRHVRGARRPAELPGVDARRARGCRHAASRSRRACTLPCPLLCPAAVMPWPSAMPWPSPAPPADSVCSVCVRNGEKKNATLQVREHLFLFFW